MRNLRDVQSFISELERLSCLEFVTKRSTEVLSRIVPNDGVTQRFSNTFRIRTRERADLIALGILSWYLPEEIGVILRLSIEEHVADDPHLERQERIDTILPLVLTSKGTMLCFLIDSNLWSTRDFFGNIYNEEILRRLIYQFSPQFQKGIWVKTKRVQRHRGYRDKGTYRDVSRSNPNAGINLNLEEKELELRRIRIEHSYQFLLGFIT